MSNDEQTTIGRGAITGDGDADAVDFAWDLHATRGNLTYKPFKNTVELLRYLDDEGYPGAYLESSANDPDYFVARGRYDDTLLALRAELRGVTATIYDAIDRLELLAPDDAENLRAIRDVKIMFIQLTESIHNKIRDYDGTP